MSLENKPIGELTETDLEQLITDKIQENKTIDYKRLVDLDGDGKRKEFLADVSSFANTSGGHMVIGMDEDNGLPTELCGMTIANPDAEILRLEDIIRGGISPRIPGISLRAIDVQSKGVVAIVIRIPKSWASPHMVTFGGTSRFFARKSAGKYQLDVDELRSAFVLSETIAERIRGFRTDRIGKIISDELPMPVSEGAKIGIHLVPLNSFASGTRVDLEILLKDNAADIYNLFHIVGINNHRRNFDGILAYATHAPPAITSRIQIFANGCIEWVHQLSTPDEKTIRSGYFEAIQIEMLARFLQIYRILNVEPPVYLLPSILGVHEHTMELQHQSLPRTQYPVDRDNLIMSEELLESLEVEPSTVLKPAFDAVWNATGFAESLNYNEAGNRIVR